MRTIAERLASIRKEARSNNSAGVLNEAMLLEGALAPVVIACACCGVATASGSRKCPSCGGDPALGARPRVGQLLDDEIVALYRGALSLEATGFMADAERLRMLKWRLGG